MERVGVAWQSLTVKPVIPHFTRLVFDIIYLTWSSFVFQNKIQLSVVSAHKLVELYRLFDAAGGDHQATLNKNYASKPQHLVLLQGFR